MEQVYHEYAPRVFTVARGLVGSDTDAEDVTQDVLLQVIRKLPSFRGDAAFPTWLHRVTVNAALDHRRRRVAREERGLGQSLTDFREEPTGRAERPPEDHLLGRETRGLIDGAVAALPAMYRDVFLLADSEELPNAEVAERLGMSLPAVKSRLHRARAMLRRTLAPHFEEAGV